MKQTYQNIYDLAKKLYPIPRSLTGEGVRQTLKIIKEMLTLSRQMTKKSQSLKRIVYIS